MVYSFSDRFKVNELFTKYFGVGFSNFYDNLSPVMGRLTIDLADFDDWLHERIGNYEDSNMSMSDVITKHFGQEANELIKSLI